jgi:hypothetical protein
MKTIFSAVTIQKSVSTIINSNLQFQRLLTVSLSVILTFCSLSVSAQNITTLSSESISETNELAFNAVTDVEIEILGCDWCHLTNCVSVKSALKNSEDCGYYAKVTNNTSARITFKLCVQKLNGEWDCGMDELKGGQTSSSTYYCNVGNGPRTKIWAAYGELFNTGCEFPRP